MELPPGVTLSGTVDPIREPTKTTETATEASAETETTETETAVVNQEHHECCGGLGGWAYPLGYWNAFGAGIYGGGCGLGIPFGGLFYC
ncbi:hypothetical protein PybrP1_000886 [[Pythium] brassicae (nom. inval.)]|nr:hypothetical protein PybrP1_000886 [[Pythium] brassicae (nom. inval.)]